jgi:hypothetical protein
MGVCGKERLGARVVYPYARLRFTIRQLLQGREKGASREKEE